MKDRTVKRVLIGSTLLVAALSMAIVLKERRETAFLALYLPITFLAVADVVIGKLRAPKDKGKQISIIDNWDPMLIRRRTSRVLSAVGLILLSASIATNLAAGESLIDMVPLIVLIIICLDGVVRNSRPIKIYKNGLQMFDFVAWENVVISEPYMGEVVIKFRFSRVLGGDYKVRIGECLEKIRELKRQSV